MRDRFQPVLERAHHSYRMPLVSDLREHARMAARTSSVREKDAQAAFTGHCRLLKLPSELLLMIYAFTLYEDGGMMLPNSTSCIQSVPEPSLLHTHHILRQHAIVTYYRVNKVHIVLNDYPYEPWKLRSPSETGLTTWLSAIGEANIADIRNLVFVLERGSFSWALGVHFNARGGRPTGVGLTQENDWLACSVPSCRPCHDYKAIEEKNELIRMACATELEGVLGAMSWAGITKEELLRLETTVGPVMISHIKHITGPDKLW